MKKLCFIPISLVFLGCGTNIHFPYNSSEPDYNGHVKTVEEIKYETVKKDETNDMIKRRVVSYFDRKGNSVKDYSYDSDGLRTEECNCTIKNDGREKDNVCLIKNGDSINTVRGVYKYDEKGRKIAYDFYWGNKYSGKREFKYEVNSINYIDYGYDKDNQLKDKTLILHNKQGKKIKTIEYTIPSGEIKGITEYYYDKNGNEVATIHFSNGKKHYSSYCKYDHTKDILYRKNYYYKTEKDSSLNADYEIHYEYDNHKNVVSELVMIRNEKYLTKKVITYY